MLEVWAVIIEDCGPHHFLTEFRDIRYLHMLMVKKTTPTVIKTRHLLAVLSCTFSGTVF